MRGSPFGRYGLLELLGRGGMGEVWKAFDTRTDRVVAVKVLRAEMLTQDSTFQQRFRRESKAAASIRSPHVVPIHDYGEIDGRLYIEMALIDGRDLSSLLAGGALDPHRSVQLVEQVARGLDAAHRLGIVHRDVKPSNVLVAENDFVYVIDFGLAAGAEQASLTATGLRIGTAAYMAPERFVGNVVDIRTDVYALACLLYECLLGTQPFPGRDFGQQLTAHLHSRPPRPTDYNPALPSGFDDVVATGMAKELDDRYPTTVALAAAARAALNSAPRTTPAPRPTDKVSADRPHRLPPLDSQPQPSRDFAPSPPSVPASVPPPAPASAPRPSAPATSRPIVQKVLATLDEVSEFVTDEDGERLAGLREHLDHPLRIALVGRINAGKSTLLNALVGQRVAPTNEKDCTQVVTCYRFGIPARIDVVGRDGRIDTFPIRGSLPDDLGRPPPEIDYAVAYLPSGVLRDYELIDTPGLAGINSVSSAATRRALGPDSVTNHLATDVKVFLGDGAPRADEMDFLKDIGATRIDTMALLSHADTFGDGAFGDDDPVDMARKHIDKLKAQLANVASTVVAAAGLLAETTSTGNLTENDARALQAFAAMDDFEVEELLLSGSDDVIDVDRLLSIVGEYGVMFGRRQAQSGAAQLGRWLDERSGLAEVRAEFGQRFLQRSDVLRAKRIFDGLHQLALNSPHRGRMQSILESAQLEPDMHRLREVNALELILKWDPLHPLINELELLCTATTDAQRLGLPIDTARSDLAEPAKNAFKRAHGARLTAISAAEREAWTVVERSYQLLFAASR